MNSRKQIEEKVFSYIEKHHMLESGDRVVAGISGGADSVCLLFVLLEWAKRCPLELVVVHVNHGVRREAKEDAAYVEELCRQQQLAFYQVNRDVPALAKEEKLSEEEMGRRVRYEAFGEIAEKTQASKIAVAHNSNDRSETMLFHLFRGSGIKGLSGICPVRDRVIRPLLCLERTEIEWYLAERGLPYCQDATNRTDDYTRNRIRHHILPFAQEQIAQGCVQHMVQTAELLEETEDYLLLQTKKAEERCVCQKGGTYQIEAAAFAQEHVVIQKRLLHGILKELSPCHKDISRVHVEQVQELLVREGNRSIYLPFGIRAKRVYDRVILEIPTQSGEAAPEEQSETLVSLPEVFTEGWMQEISLSAEESMLFVLRSAEKICEEVPTGAYTKWFDCDKIKGALLLRGRRTGDYFTIGGREEGLSHKQLKAYMIEQKIPADSRNQLPVLAEEGHVLWLAGYRISEYYKISENTKHILQVQLIRKEALENGTEDKNG